MRSIQTSIWRPLVRLLVAASCMSGATVTYAADTYDGTYLTIPLVVIGSTTYSNVVITVGSVVSATGGAPTASYDTYDVSTSLLTISSVLANNTTYTNVKITVGKVISVGGSYPTSVTTSQLNDTGVTAGQCYQAGSSVLVGCNTAAAIALNSTQDGMYGRDANAATNGDADGSLGFSFSAVAGGCVQDNVTGLMWEVKTTDGGLRDWRFIYTNKGDGSARDASGFVKAVNATNLCSHNDWRLPSTSELQSIVNYGIADDPYSVTNPRPTLDATWFPNTKCCVYWSSDQYLPYNNGLRSGNYGIWYVNFYDGDIGHGGEDDYDFVRLVRAGAQVKKPRYTVSADGQEVTDSQTNLIWRRCAEGMVAYGGICQGIASALTNDAALQQAAAEANNTGKAWRLPNVKELSSIIDKGVSSPATDRSAFPTTPAGNFWSVTPYVVTSGEIGYLWYVDFRFGLVDHKNDSFLFPFVNYLRLVRTGQ